MKLYYPITVDLYQPYPLPIMEAQQNNIGRGALVTLTAQGAVITPTEESIQLYAKKPDGTISYLACTLTGSQIECDFTNQMLALPGMVQVELQMIGGESGAETEITTPIFCVRVNPSNVDDSAVESQDEFPALVTALAELADLKEHGLKGDPGEAATIQVGTVTASDPGSTPQVTNSGTEQDAVFNFVLPRGEQGPTGPAGPTQVYFGARSSFPETGQENMLYVDNTVNPALAYIWNGSAYIPAGGGGEIAYDNAGAHNSIYRGKNLGTTVTEEQWEAISSGTFTDLYIGDYWVIGGVNWRIAAFDYYLNCGDTSFTKHHAVIVPDTCLYDAQMNATNVTTGAYKGSAIYTANLAQAKSTINSAFGSSHVLSHRIYLSNATSNGRASAGEWTDSTVDLMCEHMVYGSGIFSPVSDGSSVPNNYRVEKGQLPLFALEPSRICNRATWWLRDVITAATFATVRYDGDAYYTNASNSFGVRPAFCIG